MGRDITGVVSDPEGPLPGAEVTVQGSDDMEITDEKGAFTISAETGDVLVISFMGMKDQTVKVDSRSSYTIKMAPDATELGPVDVVRDYGKMNKSDRTGSTVALEASSLTKSPTASVETALAGKLSGVRVSSSSGQPGQSSNIQI